MTVTTTTAAPTTAPTTAPTSPGRQRALRRIVGGALPFDGVMGVVCIAAAGHVSGWLSLGAGAVRGTGVAFLAAAAAGAWALRRTPVDAREVVAANAAFALWCLALLVVGEPNALGGFLLGGSVLGGAGTAAVERRLSDRARGTTAA